MGREIKQFEIYWTNLGPTVGGEMRKTRPCVIVSPDELNGGLRTVLVAPLTTRIRDSYAFRSEVRCDGHLSQVGLDQIRCIDKSRLSEKIGDCSVKESAGISEILVEMFMS